MRKQVFSLIFFVMTIASAKPSNACTRVVYKGLNNYILTARTMDWKEDSGSNLWIFPRGMERNGATDENTLRWKSKYGSVVTSAYEICSTDGMNEKGLSANLLWLVESAYPPLGKDKPSISIAAWLQYMLDNFATVEEAVSDAEKGSYDVVSGMMPDGTRMATLHLSLSDSKGDNAIFEYIGGELVIHHDPSYQVMTNSPVFSEQLALEKYWKAIGGTTFLPGTNRAADRFVRASFYTHAIPQVDDERLAVAGIFSVIRNASVPLGITTPGQPNISSTIWRTVADQRYMMYYFESPFHPNIFWVNLKDIDFSEGSSVRKLDLVSGRTYVGNTAEQFIDAEPFVFYPVLE